MKIDICLNHKSHNEIDFVNIYVANSLASLKIKYENL